MMIKVPIFSEAGTGFAASSARKVAICRLLVLPIIDRQRPQLPSPCAAPDTYCRGRLERGGAGARRVLDGAALVQTRAGSGCHSLQTISHRHIQSSHPPAESGRTERHVSLVPSANRVAGR